MLIIFNVTKVIRVHLVQVKFVVQLVGDDIIRDTT